MGSIFKRGKVWWITYYHGSERVRESTGTPSKKRAEQLLTKREAQMFEGRFRIQDTKPSPFFSGFARVYLSSSAVNKRPRTYERDQTLIKHLSASFGKLRLSEITVQSVEQYKGKASVAGKDKRDR